MDTTARIEWSLWALRVGVFIVMLVWTLDKFINPDHASSVYEHFYFIPKETAVGFMMLLASLEMILILAFVVGFKKRITYGLVLLFHAVSVLSSWKIYMDPFGSPNILFWAAIPMLSACGALYLLRDLDRKLTACSLCQRFCKKTESI